MTKDQFIEIIKGRLTGGVSSPDLDEKYHPRRIELLASMAFKEAVYSAFNKRMDEKDLYTRRYKVSISKEEEEEGGEYFSTLPVGIMELPDNAGVHKISSLDGVLSFHPVPRLADDVFSNLEVVKVDPSPSYHMEYNKIVYRFNDWKHFKLKNVFMWLVLPLESYEGTDELVIPAGRESLIMNFVFESLGKQLPADDIPNLKEEQL